MSNKEHTLYLFVRTDMDSMTPGRIAAQCAHAGNQVSMVFEADGRFEPVDRPDDYNDLDNWHLQADKFGRTIVFGKIENGAKETGDFYDPISLDEEFLNELEDIALTHSLYQGVVHDPTYPIIDGDVMHLVSIDTVAWLFVPAQKDSDVREFLNKFKLL